MTNDVRAIANYVFDVAASSGRPISNMAMNKVVFFAYEDFLLRFGRKLTDAKIEAWEHGPVFRELYTALKKYGDGPIENRITRFNPQSSKEEVCLASLTLEEREFLDPIVTRLIGLSASKLRNLSHLSGSAWDKVWNHNGVTNAGMEISDEIILDARMRSQ